MMPKVRKAAGPESIYQLRVVLRDVEPAVWRRVLVRSTTTLAELHAILQDAMGWQNYHLWEFTVGADQYEAPDPEATGKDASKFRLKELALEIGDTFAYTYDPGDEWQHDVIVEDRLAAEPDQAYPVCTGGARACPPEDSGGPHRYAEVLEIMQNWEHPDFRETANWLGTDFHPEAFDLRATNRILMLAFGGGGAV